jgi:pentatricopeptide repeat protein
MRQIQHESGARIFFPTTRKTPPWAEPSNADSITIVGSKSATGRARELIAARVADYYTGIGASIPEPSPLTPERETSVAAAHSAFASDSKVVGAQLSHSADAVDVTSLTPIGADRTASVPPIQPPTTTAVVLSSASPTPPDTDGELPSDAVIRACAKHIDVKGVLSWLDVMKETGLWVGRLKPSTCAAIVACTGAKNSVGVVRWYRAVQQYGPNVNEHTFNMAVKAFAYAGDIRGTESWISAMRRVGFVPNAASFNAVVNRFARAGDVRNAEKWLVLMQGAGSVPGQLTFNSIIQAYTLAADPIGATRWYEAMQVAQVAPNEKTFSSIINAHAQAKKIAGAEQWFEEMEKSGFAADVVSFNTVINACAQVRDVQRAVSWLDRMRQSGVQPNQVTYNVMIKAHALSGDVVGAVKWFDEMRKAEFPHNLRSFSSMATAYGQALTVDLDQVQAMVDEMKVMTLHPDHEVLTSLLKCCAHATPPNPDLAVQWFKEFVPKAHLLAHVERALRQACGNDRADDVIAWAKTTCPQAAAPRRQHSSRRNDNRGNASRNGTNGGRNGNGGGSGRVAAQDSGDGIARKLQFEGEV